MKLKLLIVPFHTLTGMSLPTVEFFYCMGNVTSKKGGAEQGQRVVDAWSRVYLPVGTLLLLARRL